ncbi:MAG: hypothetical protein Q4D42_09175, partial [Eubacteriales bacterium]|nr:hypothetical protein [Eubacteriales bacterium]
SIHRHAVAFFYKSRYNLNKQKQNHAANGKKSHEKGNFKTKYAEKLFRCGAHSNYYSVIILLYRSTGQPAAFARGGRESRFGPYHAAN